MKKLILLTSSAIMLPSIAFAQNFQDLDGIETFIKRVGDIIDLLPPIIIGVAVVVFLWGVVKFILAGDNDDARSAGKKTMIWGIVGILVMVSLWGIISLVQGFIGVPEQGRPDVVDEL